MRRHLRARRRRRAAAGLPSDRAPRTSAMEANIEPRRKLVYKVFTPGTREPHPDRGNCREARPRFGMHKRSAATTIALVGVLVGVACALVAASTAGAATPCWKRVINQWLDNKPIATTYKPACYRQALNHVPEDLRDYSDITDAINAALQASLRGGGPSGGASNSTNPGPTGTGDNKTSGTSPGTSNPETKNRSRQGLPAPPIHR